MNFMDYGSYPTGGVNKAHLRNSRPRVVHVDESIVRELVELIRIEAEYAVCERSNFIAEVESNGLRYRLEMDADLQYENEQLLHWECPYLLHITPLWKEIHVFNLLGEEYPNDFDISYINTLLKV